MSSNVKQAGLTHDSLCPATPNFQVGPKTRVKRSKNRKKLMKKLTIAASLVGGAIMASQSVYGAFTANDLYLGFQNQAGGASSDYIINLGPSSSILGGTSLVDLTSDFSLSDFN